MSRIDKHLHDLRILTTTTYNNSLTETKNSKLQSQNTSIYPLNTSRSTRSIIPSNHSFSINKTYMFFSSPNRNSSTKNLQLSIPKATSPFMPKASSSKLKKRMTFIDNSFRNQKPCTFNHTKPPFIANTNTFITCYKNKASNYGEHSHLEFSASEYVLSSPANRVVNVQPLFKNASALFKTKSARHFKNNSVFNLSERNLYRTRGSKRDVIIDTNLFANKIKNQLKHGQFREVTKDDRDFKAFEKELKQWTLKKENEWKNLY